MGSVFGSVRQVGHVVSDADAAMRYWTQTLEIGPFFVMREIEFESYFYRGQSARSPVCTLCFAQSGDVQIELIQQHDDAPSAYREFLSSGRFGMQHLSYWYADNAAYDLAYEHAHKLGLTPVHDIRGGGARLAYFETGTPNAPMIELSEALLPGVRDVPDIVAEAGRDWDGKDPVRALA